MSDGARLLPVAESIADGSPVDWTAAQAHASAAEQEIIHQLRIVADLALLHRSLPGDPRALPASANSTTRTTALAVGNWGHLALVERIGGGSSGDVYRAWDRQLEHQVALKLLRAEGTSEDLGSSPIVKEGRLLARVRHPNVVTVHGVAVHDARFGLWMDLVRGVTLEQLLAKQGPFSAREAELIGIDLCRALAAIHAAGLIHRDVKAQNVMREDGGRIVLMDLGTGRETDSNRGHALADLAGTPLYLAPELFEGANASERTDLYSLGVLLYHLVTGSFPVRAATFDELTEAHATGTALRLRDARADLPTKFVQVIDRATAKDPKGRYASAGALEADLAAALDETGGASPENEVTNDRGGRRTTWRRPGVLVMALAAALVLVAGLLLRGRFAPATAAGTIRSIAVLPMANLSGDPSQEYFADGMTDALIGNLAKIRPLRVISRTSIMQYKGKNTSLRDIAAALNVDAVLEASVLRSGDRVRISADLVNVASDRHVWADTYERDVRDVLGLQSDLARRIAREVRIQLTPQQQAGLVPRPSVDPAAYEAYLQGRYYWNKRSDEGLQTALMYFQRAAEIDQTFAEAYAGQADVYNLLPSAALSASTGQASPFVTYPLAKAAASQALAIDPTLGEANTSLAYATFIFDRDWSGAEAEFQRALQFNPGYATAHQWYGEYLITMGRFEEAFAEYELARALDPLSPAISASIGAVTYYARRYDDAITELRTSIQLDPGNSSNYYFLAGCYEQKGMLAEAGVQTRRGLQLAPQDPFLLAELGRVAARSGDRTEALRVAGDLIARSRQEGIPADAIAFIFTALGDRDRAFEFLMKAEEERWPGVLLAKILPELDPIRTDPRFGVLLRKLRFASN